MTTVIIQTICSVLTTAVTILVMFKGFVRNMVTKNDLKEITAQIDKLDKKLDNNIEKEAHTCERVAVLEYAVFHHSVESKEA